MQEPVVAGDVRAGQRLPEDLQVRLVPDLYGSEPRIPRRHRGSERLPGGHEAVPRRTVVGAEIAHRARPRWGVSDGHDDRDSVVGPIANDLVVVGPTESRRLAASRLDDVPA